MNVELASADLHLRLEEAFGLPTPSDSKYEEIVGAYHLEDGAKYWMFNSGSATWRVVGEDGSWHRHKLVATDWSENEKTEVAKIMNDLCFMAPPQAPSSPLTSARSAPFAYRGWLFAWFFFPELRRWELAPLERR
jgi:hypothetical protein